MAITNGLDARMHAGIIMKTNNLKLNVCVWQASYQLPAALLYFTNITVVIWLL